MSKCEHESSCLVLMGLLYAVFTQLPVSKLITYLTKSKIVAAITNINIYTEQKATGMSGVHHSVSTTQVDHLE